jgi:hypothetical protein
MELNPNSLFTLSSPKDGRGWSDHVVEHRETEALFGLENPVQITAAVTIFENPANELERFERSACPDRREAKSKERD